MSVNVRHSSASNEHYTPPNVIEAARAVLGGIDLDPASSELGNTVVKAKKIFSAYDDGYHRAWRGRIFLNPPGGKMVLAGKPVSSQKAWWFKLVEEYRQGHVSAAIFVSFSIELLQTCQVKSPPGLPLPFDFPICFPSRRLAYWKEASGLLVESSSPPHSSMLIFLCDREDKKLVGTFKGAFQGFGRVVVPR